MEEEFSSLLLSNFFEITLQPISLGIVFILLLIILLLFCSALISGAEVAYFSLSPNDVENLNEDKSKGALLALKLLENPNNLLATILISNNFINIAIIILASHLTSVLFNFSRNPFLEFIFLDLFFAYILICFTRK